MTRAAWFILASSTVFLLVYLLAVQRLPRLAVVPYQKAPLWKRIGAGAVDYALALMSLVLLKNVNVIALLAVGALYLLLRDGLNGRSFGKLVFGLLAVDLQTGHPTNLRDSVRRNFLLVIPGSNVAAFVIELVAVMIDSQRQRLGDRIAHTQVVEGTALKDLVAELQQEYRRLTLALTPSARPRRTPAVVS